MDLVLNMNLTMQTLVSFNVYYLFLLCRLNKNKHYDFYEFMSLPLLNTHLRDFYPKIY